MKKIVNKVVCAMIMIIVFRPFIAQGQRPESFMVDDITYKFDNNSSTHVYVSDCPDNSISVTIPRSVVCEYSDYDDRDENGSPKEKRITCTVTSIGDVAFLLCESLTSITIPDSVTSIGYSAFSSCKSLTNITIPDSVTSIGDYAFSGCSSLTSVTIGDSVTSIGDCVFSGCSSLTSVTIGDSVASIGERAFYSCKSLTSVTIPNRVTNIGEYAFYDCSSLTSVTIPDSVTNMGEAAFRGCSSLTSVTIPDSVASIGRCAFYDCSSLTSVTIPNSVTNIGEYAFYDCSSLNDVYLSDIGAWCGIDFVPTVIPTVSIYCYCNPFYYAKNLYLDGKLVTSLEIPEGVTRILDYAFYNVDCIQNISIPDSVTSIGSNSFQNCDNIISAKAPQCVMGTGLSSTFDSSYQKLQSLCLGANVTAIGADEFNGCRALTHIEVEAGNVCYVKGEDGCLYDIERKQLLFCPRDKERISIPKGVTTIGNFAFQYCTNLVSVSMPNTLQKIGTYSFQGCPKLIGVTIPNSVKVLPPSAFDGCDVLWTDWYRALALLAINGGGSSGGEGVEPVDPRYALSANLADRSIATVTVDGDTSIASFVLTDGKVYDTVVRVINVSDGDVRLSLPQGYVYEQFKGASPLVIPATSTNLLTITRTAERVFFVSREELESAQ